MTIVSSVNCLAFSSEKRLFFYIGEKKILKGEEQNIRENRRK